MVTPVVQPNRPFALYTKMLAPSKTSAFGATHVMASFSSPLYGTIGLYPLLVGQ